MGDIIAIKQGLAQRAQDVAAMLLPRGHKEGNEWRCGSLQGEPWREASAYISQATRLVCGATSRPMKPVT